MKTAATSSTQRLDQYVTGGMDIIIAGTADAVMMVEGGGDEISEDEFLGAVEFAQAEIKKIVKAIDQLAKKVGKKKREFPVQKVDADLDKWIRKSLSPKTLPKPCASWKKASASALSRPSRSAKRPNG